MVATGLLLRNLGVVVIILISAFLVLQSPLFHSEVRPRELHSSKLSSVELDSVLDVRTQDDFVSLAARSSHEDSPVKNYTSGHRHDKRVLVMSYDFAVCKGTVLWNDIQAAFNGQRPPGQQFGRDDFDSSWTLAPDSGQLPTGGHWENPFKSFTTAGAVPGGPSISGRAANQDKSFKNVAGRQVA
ncbi:MAG: hypothetical protein Q9224_007161, partial [Gallowayella concinna]